MFLVNSRLDHFSAPISRWVPLSRSYGVNLPSSLARIHSSTLGSSPRPPVSVYGTGRITLTNIKSFLHVCLPALSALPWHRGTVGFQSPYVLQPSIPSDGGHVTPRSRSRLHSMQRNINRFCIAYASRLLLSSRLTLIRLTLFRKPWAVGGGLSIPLIVTHAYIFFSNRSSGTRRTTFSAGFNAPLPHTLSSVSSASAAVLMPGHHPRVTARLVSCYALFE